jgi:hypothetical protein
MSNFVWITAADKNSAFGISGISGSYIIPKGDMTVNPQSLAGNRLWVILRGTDDRILQSLTVKKIERIIEGYYEGDYLLSVDLLSSFRLVSKYAEASNYIATNTDQLAAGLSEINEKLSRSFSQLVKKRIEIKLAEPKVRSGIDNKILPRSGELLAKSALRLIISRYNLNEIWAAGTGKKLGTFANFANSIIKKHVSEKAAAELTDILSSYDPITALNNEVEDDDSGKEKSPNTPQVDTDFTEVEPEKIYAREFLSAGDKFKDLEAALNKTEHAEKIHQEMLKDIAEFLISNGVTPFESGSIDLMFQANNKLKVCEIKSTTLENLLAQSSKGAFQLTCYIDELIKSYDDTLPQLILRRIGNNELESFAQRILSKMNIPVLFYDPSKSWPNRVPQLLS